jgi:hypothetical protein
VESTGLVEEPISAELVLVDRELARRARAALPDPPWLLPVLAEQRQAEEAAPSALTEERSAPAPPAVARRPRRRSVARHVVATAASGCVLLALAVLAASAADLLSGSEEPTFVTTPVRHAAAPQPSRSSVVTHARRKPGRSEPQAKRAARRSEPRRSENARASANGTPAARSVHKRPGKRASAPKPAPTNPPVLAKTQRVFRWHRHAAAVYYQFYFQRGATTIYQARTVKLIASLPARLKLSPGTYHVLVRPAIPSDAGIILGAAIVEKTMRV